MTDDLTHSFSKAASANKLLERKPDISYIGEWTELVKKEKETENLSEESSIVIFRISNEWFALATSVCAEVMKKKKIHTLPHKTNATLLGCVNFRGQLWLCASLRTILEVPANDKEHTAGTFQRMLAIQKGQEQWIFAVEEVLGIYHLDSTELHNVPVTIQKSKANYIKGLFYWQNLSIAVLDEELLFYSLQRSLL